MESYGDGDELHGGEGDGMDGEGVENTLNRGAADPEPFEKGSFLTEKSKGWSITLQLDDGGCCCCSPRAQVTEQL